MDSETVFVFSCVLAITVVVMAPLYVSIYQIDEMTRNLSIWLLVIFAGFSLIKVQNMVIGGGILRSGGKPL